MPTPEQRALLQKHISIDGDGNVGGDGNIVNVDKSTTVYQHVPPQAVDPAALTAAARDRCPHAYEQRGKIATTGAYLRTQELAQCNFKMYLSI